MKDRGGKWKEGNKKYIQCPWKTFGFIILHSGGVLDNLKVLNTFYEKETKKLDLSVIEYKKCNVKDIPSQITELMMNSSAQGQRPRQKL